MGHSTVSRSGRSRGDVLAICTSRKEAYFPSLPDSRSCQPRKKDLEAAAEASLTLIVQVKDNQPTLHQQIQETCATTAPPGCASSHDRGRNRDERRTVALFDPAGSLAEPG